jgi:prophage antirepressor-like protein
VYYFKTHAPNLCKMSLVKKSCNIGGVTAEVWIVEVEKDKFMYGGHGIAQFLGYTNPRKAVRDHVKLKWRKNWEEISRGTNRSSYVTSCEQTVNWHPHTVFLSEAGVYALIMRSKLPAAEEFQRWLFEEVLPELRKSGIYSSQDQQASCSKDVVNYDKKLANAQMETLQLKLKLSEANTTIANYNTTISEMKRNYEQQISEFKEREYKMQMNVKDLANAATTTMTQFAVNALLARDNIEENEQMRQTLTDISGRVVPGGVYHGLRAHGQWQASHSYVSQSITRN